MIYSIWVGESITLIPGHGPPVMADGTLQDPRATRAATFTATDFDDATAKLERWLRNHYRP